MSRAVSGFREQLNISLIGEWSNRAIAWARLSAEYSILSFEVWRDFLFRLLLLMIQSAPSDEILIYNLRFHVRREARVSYHRWTMLGGFPGDRL